jgi:hypothetical protein
MSMTNPVGRPSKYKPEYAKQALKLCYMGATDAELADFFDVSIKTIWNWKVEHQDFLLAINKVEKEFADGRVQRSLYQRACGYTFDAVKIFNGPKGTVTVPYREHVPPDPVSCFFWLKNRRPEIWRDQSPTNNIQDNRTFTITIGNAKLNGQERLIEHAEQG